MMEQIKRHAFLGGLIAGVVVLSLAIFALVFFLYMGSNSQQRGTLQRTKSQAEALLKGPLFNEDLVKQMAEQVDRRRKQYDALIDLIRSLGAARPPMVKDLFPVSTQIELRHLSKSEYDAALARFMKRLGAVAPKVPDVRGGKITMEEIKILTEENRQAAMFASQKVSFFRPDWVDKQEAPSLEMVRNGQENLWLQEDIVEILATMNDDIRKAAGLEPRIEQSPIKELIEIRIGAEYGGLPGSGGSYSGTGRYRPAIPAGARVAANAPVPPAPTLSGHNSKPDFYLVLPFRLSVVVDSRYVGEVMRRLKGRESFLSIEAWRVAPIVDATIARSRGELQAQSREDYGPHGVVRLDLAAESLVFQVPGGRVTTVAKAPSEAEKGQEKTDTP